MTILEDVQPQQSKIWDIYVVILPEKSIRDQFGWRDALALSGLTVGCK